MLGLTVGLGMREGTWRASAGQPTMVKKLHSTSSLNHHFQYKSQAFCLLSLHLCVATHLNLLEPPKKWFVSPKDVRISLILSRSLPSTQHTQRDMLQAITAAFTIESANGN